MYSRNLIKNIDKVITEYTFDLIRDGKAIMFFPDNNQLLLEKEADEWIATNGLMNGIPRVLGHKTTTKSGVDIYILHHTDDLGSIIIPMERFDIFPMYKDFMYQLKKDLVIER